MSILAEHGDAGRLAERIVLECVAANIGSGVGSVVELVAADRVSLITVARDGAAVIAGLVVIALIVGRIAHVCRLANEDAVPR